MSRISAVTILLIILVNSLCSSAAAPSHGVSLYIRKCRCTEISTGRFKCPKPLKPTNYNKQRDVFKCVCKKIQEEKRSDLLRFCRVINKKNFADLL